MTIPTYAGLGTALSGLEAMQAGIDTTSENISNASNPDYARQTVNLVDSNSVTFATGGRGNPVVEMGTGVTIGSITRNDDQFVDGQYWTANASSSYYSTLSTQLTNTEGELNTSSTAGLQGALNSFYSAWQSLSTNPSVGSSVIEAGQTLAQQLNAASQQISTLQSQAGAALANITAPGTGELQQYANDIAGFNTQIAQASAAGVSSNTLQDQRAQVLDKLSALANIKVSQAANGSDTVTLVDSSGVPVGSSPLVVGITGGTPPQVPDPNAPGTVNLPASTGLSSIGGTIGALAQLADTNAADANAPLAQMQQQLSDLVSNSSGTGVADLVNKASGTSFFTTSDGTSQITAANITVSSAVTPATLATLSNTTDSAVYATQTKATNDLATFVSQVGNTAAQASDSASTSSTLLTNISNQRQSVSGVSLDEEMTHLITFQQGYQASARVMNAMQTVIQSLLTSIGG